MGQHRKPTKLHKQATHADVNVLIQFAADIPGDEVSNHIDRQQFRVEVAARCDGKRLKKQSMQAEGEAPGIWWPCAAAAALPALALAASAFLVSWGITAPASLLRAKRPLTRGLVSARVLRHMYLIRLVKLRSCRFWRYLQHMAQKMLSIALVHVCG